MTAKSIAPARVSAAIAAAVAAVGLVLGSTGYMIARAQSQSRSSATEQFRASTDASSAFVGAVLGARIDQEESLARAYFSRTVSPAGFSEVASTFGLASAVLAGSRGALVAVAHPGLLTPVLVAAAASAVRGPASPHAVVEYLGSSARTHAPVIATAVPFPSAQGVRVLAAASIAEPEMMRRFVAGTETSLTHPWLTLVDGAGRVVASSASTRAPTLQGLSPRLATAVAASDFGSVAGGRRGALTFAVAPVEGTRWRLVVAVPTAALYAGSSGLSGVALWVLFGATVALAVALTVVFARSLRDRRALRAFSLRMQHAATTDPLTGLPNRRAVESDMQRVAASRERGPHSLLMIDLDRFKDVNDTYGHGVGDAALRAVAAAMRTVLRKGDIYGRWGGDEFVAVLPELGPDAAAHVVDRLRGAIAARTVATASGSLRVEASIGCATAAAPSWHALLLEADETLYREKAEKKCVAPDPVAAEAPARARGVPAPT
ncbi:MAG TPA: GGDEF domain-containing protein [Acidimicrobiales bacterium]|nr:GGDEF domain-containing protein [Acidimicrobiales bacterium]